MKKNIYSLSFLSENLKASNKRYLEFISAFDNKEVGRKRLEKVTSSKNESNRNYKGFNFFSKDDLTILTAIIRGEFNINGFRNKNLQKLLGFTGSKISRLIKRLRVASQIFLIPIISVQLQLTPLLTGIMSRLRVVPFS
ncbi:MAG: hypothetical protein WAW07_14515 [Bacteroidales bacterium]